MASILWWMSVRRSSATWRKFSDLMPTILITGISGFVGAHIAKYLMTGKQLVNVHGISRSEPTWDFVPDFVREKIVFHQANLLDPKQTARLISEISPDWIIHLASFSSVAKSWGDPVASFLNNAGAFLNVAEAVRQTNLSCRILSVGSSEEYGLIKRLPVVEDEPIIPANPYAVARVSQEHLALMYAQGFGLDIVCTRSFNHIGPGQSPHFVISSIVKRFAEIKLQQMDPVVTIGKGDIVRDFLDIEDVIAAYELLLEKGERGEVYNVCSGQGHKIMDVINLMSEITDIGVSIEQDAGLMRPVDNPILIGSYDKLMKRTGWQPKVQLAASLKKIFAYWHQKLNDVNKAARYS